MRRRAYSMRWLQILLASVLLSGLAALTPSQRLAAATLTLTVTDTGQQALPDAVATLIPDSPDNSSRPPPRDHFIDQRDETFIPLVEVVASGDSVIFRNSDRTRHHVYSFSPLGSFEFVLKPNESSPPVRLQKPGVIAVGCNIHDFMISYLVVSDARWAATTDSHGQLQFADVPAGGYSLTLWHPRQRPGAPPPPQHLTVTGDAALAVVLPVLPEHRDDDDHDHY